MYFFERMNSEKMEEEKQTNKAAGMTWFSMVLTHFRPLIHEIILASLFINTLALAMPLFIMSIYDKVIGAGSTTTLRNLIIVVSIPIFA